MCVRHLQFKLNEWRTRCAWQPLNINACTTFSCNYSVGMRQYNELLWMHFFIIFFISFLLLQNFTQNTNLPSTVCESLRKLCMQNENVWSGLTLRDKHTQPSNNRAPNAKVKNPSFASRAECDWMQVHLNDKASDWKREETNRKQQLFIRFWIYTLQSHTFSILWV